MAAHKFVPKHEEWKQLYYWRMRGLSWEAIGKMRGMSLRGMWMRGKRLEKAFGPLPKVQSRRKRNYGVDIVRIREMRDAQLNWDQIGAVLGGMGGASARVYYSRLQHKLLVSP